MTVDQEASAYRVEQLVHLALLTCGTGRVLHAGCGLGVLVQHLVKRGCDAYGTDDADAVTSANRRLPGRFAAGEPSRLPYPDGHFATVIADEWLTRLPAAEVSFALAELRRVTARDLHLIQSLAPRPGAPAPAAGRDRTGWETQCFLAGFRKHSVYYRVNSYEGLERDSAEITIPLERIPDEAHTAYPLSALAPERNLHMDMLREAGRRSDAHVARYTLAADWVRRNDVVLDAGCGLGYGAHVLRSLTHARQVIGLDADERAVAYARDNFGVGVAELEYRTGDLQDLSFLPDHSLDVVVCFEAVEHVPDPDRFFAEARRVLRPGGRVVVSVPNQWCDEHGHDPNPHHLHVYTWDKLRSQLQRRFLLETAYQQIAGNGVVLSDRPRRLRSISVEAAPTVESEWWIMVGTADPTQPPCVPYQEVFYDYSAPPEHLLAFARDYANPWLVRALVEYPTRAVNRDVLLDVAGRVLADAGDGSADQGAALCVHGYRVLESDSASAEEVETFLSRLDGYLALPPQNAHQFRWRISLAFLRGQLHLKLGRFAEARAAFDFCADMDCRPFSPTLGTKTVLAAFLSGWLNYVHADVATARQRWSRGLTEAQRLLHADWAEFLGNPETPLPFPLVTAVEFLDSAVLCANALRVTAARAAVPVSLVWSEIHKCWKQMINERWRAMQRMEAMISERDETISDQARRLEERWRLVQHMDAQARSRDDIIGEQSRLLDERWAIMQRMDAMIAARDEALSAQARMLEARWRIMQHMEAEVRARDEVIAQQARRLAETEGGRPDEVRLRSDGRTR